MTGDELAAAILALPPEERALQVFDWGSGDLLYMVNSIGASVEQYATFAGCREPFGRMTRVLVPVVGGPPIWPKPDNEDENEPVIVDCSEDGSA